MEVQNKFPDQEDEITLHLAPLLPISVKPFFSSFHQNTHLALTLIHLSQTTIVFDHSFSNSQSASHLLHAMLTITKSRSRHLKLWTSKITQDRLQDTYSNAILQLRQDFKRLTAWGMRMLQQQEHERMQIKKKFDARREAVKEWARNVMGGREMWRMEGDMKELEMAIEEMRALPRAAVIELERVRRGFEKGLAVVADKVDELIGLSWDL